MTLNRKHCNVGVSPVMCMATLYAGNQQLLPQLVNHGDSVKDRLVLRFECHHRNININNERAFISPRLFCRARQDDLTTFLSSIRACVLKSISVSALLIVARSDEFYLRGNSLSVERL